MELPQFVHAALIAETQKDRLIGHIARDSTAIVAREHYPETPAQRAARKAERKAARATERAAARANRKPRPRGPLKRHKGGKPPYVPVSDTRLSRQRTMTVEEMLADLPRQCEVQAESVAYLVCTQPSIDSGQHFLPDVASCAASRTPVAKATGTTTSGS